ncbi:MAG TPA: hypothetical protein VG407_11805 [Caulobacteraceae bacterium]|jgi:uncharacterized membrane protein|nr:hypothetical protein [Caulobacteraceae bacterium]
MSADPDQKPPEPQAESTPPGPAPAPEPEAPEAAAEAVSEFFAAAPLPKTEPESEPESPAEAKPEAATTPQAPASSAPPEPVAAPPEPPVEDAPLFRTITSGPRRKGKTSRARAATASAAPRELEPEAGDFDAVFEARSQVGLGDRLTPTACYLLMIFSPLTLGLAAIPAVVLAYMNRETAPAWMAGHYVYQIRSFWAAVLVALAAMGTIFIERGIIALAFGLFFSLLLLVAVAWFVWRAANGLMRLRRGQPIANPRSWSV